MGYITTKELMTKLSCCRKTAERIGRAADAQIHLGNKAVRWNWEKIQKYLEGER